MRPRSKPSEDGRIWRRLLFVFVRTPGGNVGSSSRWALVMISLAVQLSGTSRAAATQESVPARAGVNFVLAVHTPPETAAKDLGVIEGDYEMVVTIDALDARGLALTANYDGKDEKGVWRRGKVKRLIPTRDLQKGGVHIHGWHGSDAQVIAGSTSLGPSLSFMRDVVDKGEAEYRFRMFAFSHLGSGIAAKTGTVSFPVLINGRRVELPATRAQGQMTVNGVQAPFEMIVYDHAEHPLMLRMAYGPRGAGFPFQPRFAREIVRIDYADDGMRETLNRDCRVEVPGIYFDFNRDSLKPQSSRALETMASLFREKSGRKMVIEGHTDDVGSERYNQDLSTRRAQAVGKALITDHDVHAGLVSARGMGESKPIESNATIAGRARNRRVELVCGVD